MIPKTAAIAAALLALAMPLCAGAEDPCGKNHFILDYPCQVNVLRNWRWSPAGELKVPRYLHSATLLADGRILVTGGYRHFAVGQESRIEPLTSVEIYDPATGISRVTAPMSLSRNLHQAVRLLDGRVLVTGDWIGTFPPGSLGLIGIAEIYDPVEERWMSAGSMLTPRTAHSMTLLADGRVLVAGGVNNRDETLSSAEIYDPATNTWRYTGALLEGRFMHTATRLASGTVLATGGSTDDVLQDVTASTERYDPVSETWSSTSSLGTGRQWHTATLLPNGDALIVGGYASTRETSYAPMYFSAVDRFGMSGWTSDVPLNVRRMGHAAALVAGGMVLVSGGHHYSPNRMMWFGNSGSAEAYNPFTQAWQVIADMSIARSQHTATTLADGRVVVIGGQSNGLVDDPAMRSIEIFGPSSNAALGVARRGR